MSSSARPPFPTPRALAVWVCLLAALVYLLTYAGVLHAVDEQSALSVAETMRQGQGFHVNQMEWDQARTPPQNAYGLDGNLYSKKGIGVSLVALPLFAPGKLLTPAVGAAQLALLMGSLLALVAAWAMFWLSRTLDYRPLVAALGALLLALGSPLWPYARTLFSETPGAAGLALALWGMVAWRRAVDWRRAMWLLLAGSGLALLILVKSSNAVVVPVFGLYWLWGARQRTCTRRAGYAAWGEVAAELAALALPVLLAVGATVAYNYVRFGTTLGFPLEPFETFSTPLLVGLAGLLFSTGKGIFWYFPALWLGVAFIPHWRRGGRLPDFLLAAGSALALIALYALWYDWPGGRAWGPRMIITATPALAVLVLPAIDWLIQGFTRREDTAVHGHVGVPTDPHVGVRATQSSAGAGRAHAFTHSPRHLVTSSPSHPRQPSVGTRSLVIALLVLSFAVQFPGALVNFERQEELDMQAGATFDQLLWSPAHSPLLTYWGRITATPDPLGLQPYMRDLTGGEPGVALAGALLALLAAVGLGLAAVRLRRRRNAGLWLGLTGGALMLLALLLPLLARADPRWDEQSAVREDNHALRAGIRTASQRGDVILLDLLPSSDKGRRTGQWLNFADQPYIGWLRKDEMSGAVGERLATWLAPYRQVWLVLQATDEGDPASTTEAWLNAHAFAGRRWWQGDQRTVEYLLPDTAAEAQAVEAAGPFDFGAATLHSYRLAEDETGGVRLLLRWENVGAPDIRYSVQALGPNGVLAQVDGIPAATAGTVSSPGLAEDRIGLSLPVGAERLILKLYRAADGGVLPVTTQGEPAAEFLQLGHLFH